MNSPRHIHHRPSLLSESPRSRRHQPHGRGETPHSARVAGEQRQVRDVGVRPDKMGFLDVSSGINLAPVRNDSKSRPPSPQPSPPGRGRNIRRTLPGSEAPLTLRLGPSPPGNWEANGELASLPETSARVSLSPGERVGVRAGVTHTPPLGRIRSWRESLPPPPRPALSRRVRSTRRCRG